VATLDHHRGGRMPRLPDLNAPTFASIKTRLARVYFDHKAELGVPNASDEEVLARVDEVTLDLVCRVGPGVAR
jgi:hypothetical protein